ncbi:MAG: orotidine-5'-phosphate decarboxylase [Thermoleophilia bacterium]
MSPEPFASRLADRVARRRSQVVLGLDPDPARLPGGAAGARDFCLRVIEQAAPHCVAAKPQLACFERFGADGWQAFEDVAHAAHDAGLLVIADAKRGDVDATARHYAAAFLRPPIDALTVNPMLGTDAVQPFLDAARDTGCGLFVLVRTSNPGAAELEDLPLADGRLWHEAVADRVRGWGEGLPACDGLSSVGAVVGATVPGRLVRLRALMSRQPFLLPGVGAQGGDPAALGPAFGGHAAGALVSASRSVIYADDPAAAAQQLREVVWSAWETAAAA